MKASIRNLVILAILVSTSGCTPLLQSTYHDNEAGKNCVPNSCGKKVEWDTHALALPLHNKQADYNLLREFIEARYPDHWVCFINEDETLLNPGAEKTPISMVEQAFKVKGLRLWLIRRNA